MNHTAHTACANSSATVPTMGRLAQSSGKLLPLQVLKSGAGYYLGTWFDGPFSRESVQYWKTQAMAEQALANGLWTQKPSP